MKHLFILLFLVASLMTYAKNIKIATFNVENLFDITHDTLKNDYDFLPEGSHVWTAKRYYKKIEDINKLIVSMADDYELPLFIGLCEVENDNVLNDLSRRRPYNQLNYDYIHFESSDPRGIDVALLYQKNRFAPISSKPIEARLPDGKKAREILYVCGKVDNQHTVHLFQVHMPSRRSGAITTEPNRIAVARTLKTSVDTIFARDPNAAIIIMGDFNDNPFDTSVSITLGAASYTYTPHVNGKLYNLCWNGKAEQQYPIASYFHNNQWDMLDQIIVSGALLNGSSGIVISAPAKVYALDWTSTLNDKLNIKTPKHTYLGTHYQGGVSDHFPVYATGHTK